MKAVAITIVVATILFTAAAIWLQEDDAAATVTTGPVIDKTPPHVALAPERAHEVSAPPAPTESVTREEESSGDDDAEGRAIIVNGLKREFADLDRAVMLTESERTRLLALIADHRLRAFRLGSRRLDRSTAARELEKLDRQWLADLEALLGKERGTQVIAFQRSVPARMEAWLAKALLEEAHVPLSEQQASSFTDMAIETFDREMDHTGDERSRGREVNPMLLRVARSVMDARQYAHYARYLEFREQHLRDDVEEDAPDSDADAP
jgi:hypothetical protein